MKRKPYGRQTMERGFGVLDWRRGRAGTDGWQRWIKLRFLDCAGRHSLREWKKKSACFARNDRSWLLRTSGSRNDRSLLLRRSKPQGFSHNAQAVGAAGELKLTLGASRSAVEVTSKNSRGLKPSMPAKILVGNC